MQHGRLPWPTPEKLDEDQRAFYDAVVGGVRGKVARPTPLTDDDGRLHGPFNAMLTHPAVGMALQSMGAGLRFDGTLPKWLFELLVLVVSAQRHASYEWYAHAPIGQAAGLTDDHLAAARHGRIPDGLSDGDAAVVELALTTLRHDEPAEELLDRVQAAYGASGVTETVTVVGFYDMMAGLMRTWATPLPDDAADPLA